MKSITKIIIGLLGVTAIGLLTYYVITKDKETGLIENPYKSPLQDTIITKKVIQDTIFDRIKKALSIDGEEFKLTEVDGVYTNSTKDKMLIIKEDVWKKIIRKTKKKLPNIAKDCFKKEKMPDLLTYKFVGLLTHYARKENTKITSAYSAIEIRKGIAKYYSGGAICCDCGGEPAVIQKVDAFIIK